MKLSNELKVGLLAIVAIAGLVFGFRYLKGKDVFNSTPKITATFKDVGALEKSNFVKINGLTVGSVYSIEAADKNVDSIIVTISITQDINIPANSTAYIEGSLLGSPAIVIEKGDAKTYIADGDRLLTRADAGLFGSLQQEVKPLVGKARNVADSLTLLLSNVNNILDGNTQQNLQQVIANLSYSTAALNTLLTGASKPLGAALENMNSITGNLKDNNQQIAQILGNANSFTGSLKALNLQQTIDSLNGAIYELKTTINKLSSNDGTLGALINDRQLYNRINNVALSAEILLDDLRVHPKRYVNISVFGKKNKSGELTSPAIKDTIPQ